MKAADALLCGLAVARVSRLLVVGLFANLDTPGGGDAVRPDSATAGLSCVDLAVALLDEIAAPRHHRARISVFG
ncbi:hypothetical protein [Streptomyces vietnamensis]|uniref:hypothetical protein n=1 Tax=Streptomyces vietnamensis TaxID=362257 RepID=UPI000698406C|nr:hypothetical protein [Streptomyces vietnamensis]